MGKNSGFSLKTQHGGSLRLLSGAPQPLKKKACHKGLSYQIFELEDSGLPQQGILPISARKTTTKATHKCLEKTLPTVDR